MARPSLGAEIHPIPGFVVTTRLLMRALLIHASELWVGFDRRHGTDTSGELPRPWQHLRDRNPDPESFPHYPSYGSVLERALEPLRQQVPELHFVDLGSGKGRVLLQAAELGFRRITGIEIDPALCRVAEDNAERFLKTRGGDVSIRIRCQDLVDAELPEPPLLLYIFQPVGRQRMRTLLARILEARARADGEVFVLYYNPVTRSDWLATGRCRVLGRGKRGLFSEAFELYEVLPP